MNNNTKQRCAQCPCGTCCLCWGNKEMSTLAPKEDTTALDELEIPCLRCRHKRGIAAICDHCQAHLDIRRELRNFESKSRERIQAWSKPKTSFKAVRWGTTNAEKITTDTFSLIDKNVLSEPSDKSIPYDKGKLLHPVSTEAQPHSIISQKSTVLHPEEPEKVVKFPSNDSIVTPFVTSFAHPEEQKYFQYVFPKDAKEREREKLKQYGTPVSSSELIAGIIEKKRKKKDPEKIIRGESHLRSTQAEEERGVFSASTVAMGERKYSTGNKRREKRGHPSEAQAREEKGQLSEFKVRGEKGHLSDTQAREEKGRRSESKVKGEKGHPSETQVREEKGQRSESKARGEKGYASETQVREEKGQLSESKARGEKGHPSETQAREEKGQRSESKVKGEKGHPADTRAREEKGQPPESKVKGEKGHPADTRVREEKGQPPESKVKGEKGHPADTRVREEKGQPPESKVKGEKGHPADTRVREEKGQPPESKVKGEKGHPADTRAREEKGQPPESKVKGEKGHPADTRVREEKGQPPESKVKGEKGHPADTRVREEKGQPPESKVKGEKGHPADTRVREDKGQPPESKVKEEKGHPADTRVREEKGQPPESKVKGEKGHPADTRVREEKGQPSESKVKGEKVHTSEIKTKEERGLPPESKGKGEKHHLAESKDEEERGHPSVSKAKGERGQPPESKVKEEKGQPAESKIKEERGQPLESKVKEEKGHTAQSIVKGEGGQPSESKGKGEKGHPVETKATDIRAPYSESKTKGEGGQRLESKVKEEKGYSAESKTKREKGESSESKAKGEKGSASKTQAKGEKEHPPDIQAVEKGQSSGTQARREKGQSIEARREEGPSSGKKSRGDSSETQTAKGKSSHEEKEIRSGSKKETDTKGKAQPSETQAKEKGLPTVSSAKTEKKLPPPFDTSETLDKITSQQKGKDQKEDKETKDKGGKVTKGKETKGKRSLLQPQAMDEKENPDRPPKKKLPWQGEIEITRPPVIMYDVPIEDLRNKIKLVYDSVTEFRLFKLTKRFVERIEPVYPHLLERFPCAVDLDLETYMKVIKRKAVGCHIFIHKTKTVKNLPKNHEIVEDFEPKSKLYRMTHTLQEAQETSEYEDDNIEPAPPKVIHYALSDRSYIQNGWTQLPSEKVVRKMFLYRTRPAQQNFDWFKDVKNKGVTFYDTGEKLAELDDTCHGKWFYKNGQIALDYHQSEDVNAKNRVLVYSNGEPDENGKTYPVCLLAMFDAMGNGTVYDHNGKIRIDYNQTEGMVHDPNIGPNSHWKWHSLNDPPHLQTIMVESLSNEKDPHIMKLGRDFKDEIEKTEDAEMIAIELDNFAKEVMKRQLQKFNPFQIRMKTLKINKQFSLKILDQTKVFLHFRDGLTNLKMNLGILLDPEEVVDTEIAEIGSITNRMLSPANTDSMTYLQCKFNEVKKINCKRRLHENQVRNPLPNSSADCMLSGVSRPLYPTPQYAYPTLCTCAGDHIPSA